MIYKLEHLTLEEKKEYTRLTLELVGKNKRFYHHNAILNNFVDSITGDLLSIEELRQFFLRKMISKRFEIGDIVEHKDSGILELVHQVLDVDLYGEPGLMFYQDTGSYSFGPQKNYQVVKPEEIKINFNQVPYGYILFRVFYSPDELDEESKKIATAVYTKPEED